MKVMILSDSHAMPKSDLIDLLKKNQVDYYIHCGDIFMTYDGLPFTNFYLVRGNNDFGYDIPNQRTITIDNLKFFITHGHQFDVDWHLDELYQEVKELNVDVICFGHTHRPYYDIENNTIIINPGSVSYPRGQYRSPTYCIFDTTTKEVTFYDVKTMEPCHPVEPVRKPSKIEVTDILDDFSLDKEKKEPFYKRWFKWF